MRHDILRNIIKENVKKVLKENGFDEASLALKADIKKKMNQITNRYAKEAHGDEFGKANKVGAKLYNVPDLVNDGELASGLIGVGNSKLSDDTLIINFTSALNCPAKNFCPIGQMTCYATKDEVQYPSTRRKNAKVHYLVRAMQKKGNASGAKAYFDMIKEIVPILHENKVSKRGEEPRYLKLKYVRFNEAGDFPNQAMVDEAVEFCNWAKDNYDIQCMAYTAMNNLNFYELSQVCAINASTDEIFKTFHPDATQRNFFGRPSAEIEYEYAQPEQLLDKLDAKKDNVVTTNTAKYKPTSVDPKDISVPILNKGDIQGKEVYYYICPCSFWKDEKNKIEYPLVAAYAKEHGYTFNTLKGMGQALNRKVGNKTVKHPDYVKIKKQVDAVPSPCGYSCAVCHNTSGGIDSETGNVIRNYAVLTALHGSTNGYYSPAYAALKRMGMEATYNKNNKSALRTVDTKFSGTPSENLKNNGEDRSSIDQLMSDCGYTLDKIKSMYNDKDLKRLGVLDKKGNFVSPEEHWTKQNQKNESLLRLKDAFVTFFD